MVQASLVGKVPLAWAKCFSSRARWAAAAERNWFAPDHFPAGGRVFARPKFLRLNRT